MKFGIVAGLILGILAIFAVEFLPEYEKVSATPATAWLEDRSADCGVVLTGGAGRTREGLDLLSRHQISKLIISGVHPSAQFEDIFPQWPFYSNVDKKDVILERRSTTTYGNAHQSLALIEALDCQSVVLITSRLHMRRALKTFEAETTHRIHVFPHAIVSNDYNPDWTEIALETLKSIFYSAWAYA
jgi:uncharacterized SAM-binding protein YcdF (DUF218 family)